MMQRDKSSLDIHRVKPGILIVCALLLTCIPVVTSFALFGAPSATGKRALEATDPTLAAMFPHATLETTALCLAIFTALVALEQLRSRGRVTAPIVGVALVLAAGCDALHTVIADEAASSLATSEADAAWVWAIARSGAALILIAGVCVALVRLRAPEGGSNALLAICGVGLGIILLSYMVAGWGARNLDLTGAVKPGAWLKRPWDLLPLGLYLLAGLTVLPAYHRRRGTYFSLALLLSILPEAFAHLHMALGSESLFDGNFYTAHLLKVMANLIRLGGLLLDHSRTYMLLEAANERMVHVIDGRLRAERELSDLAEDMVRIEYQLRVEADKAVKAERLREAEHGLLVSLVDTMPKQGLDESLRPDCVLVPMEATDKVGAIAELVQLLADRGLVKDPKTVLEEVWRRERINSTGIGNGIALPHAKTPVCDRLVVAVGRPRQPMEFSSADARPVQLICLMVSPMHQAGAHIRAMSLLARRLSSAQLREALFRAADAGAVYRLLVSE